MTTLKVVIIVIIAIIQILYIRYYLSGKKPSNKVITNNSDFSNEIGIINNSNNNVKKEISKQDLIENNVKNDDLNKKDIKKESEKNPFLTDVI